MVPFRAGGLEYFPAIPNPVGIPALNEAVFEAFAFVTFIVILLATISLPVRFRRARGDERQQLKWVAYAAVFLGVVGVVSPRWAPPWSACLSRPWRLRALPPRLGWRSSSTGCMTSTG